MFAFSDIIMDAPGRKSASVKLSFLFFVIIESCSDAEELPSLAISYDTCVSNSLADISDILKYQALLLFRQFQRQQLG